MSKKEDVRKRQKKKEEDYTLGFSISDCPVSVYKDFKEFCKEETNDNYSFGLKILLEAYKTNTKELVLYEQYMKLKKRVKALEEEITDSEKEEKKKPKTLGSGNKTKDEEDKNE